MNDIEKSSMKQTQEIVAEKRFIIVESYVHMEPSIRTGPNSIRYGVLYNFNQNISVQQLAKNNMLQSIQKLLSGY